MRPQRSIQSMLQDRILGCLLGQAIGLGVDGLRPSVEKIATEAGTQPLRPGERAQRWLNWGLIQSTFEREGNLEDHPTARMTRALALHVIGAAGFTDALAPARVFCKLAAQNRLDERALTPQSAALRSVVAALPLVWLERVRDSLGFTQAWATNKSLDADLGVSTVQALVESCFSPRLPGAADLLGTAAEHTRRHSVSLALDICQLQSALLLDPLAFAALSSHVPAFREWIPVGVYAFLKQPDLVSVVATSAALCEDASAAAGLAAMLYGCSRGATALPDSLVGMLPCEVLIEANEIAAGFAEPRRAPEMRMA